MPIAGEVVKLLQLSYMGSENAETAQPWKIVWQFFGMLGICLAIWPGNPMPREVTTFMVTKFMHECL